MRRRFGWFLLVAMAGAGCSSGGEASSAALPSRTATELPSVVTVAPTVVTDTPADLPERTLSPTPTAIPTQSLPAPIVTVEPIEQTGPLEGVNHVGAVMVWTGDEIVFWGGSRGYGGDNVALGFPGGAFDPATKTWRELAPAPDGSQAEAVGFWTGEEVVICCGRAGSAAPTTTQIYDPKADAWRSLPPPPFKQSVVGASAALSGDLLYVVGPEQLLALDLTTEQWSELTPPPAQVTFSPGPSFISISNGDLVLWPRPSRRSVAQGLFYDAGLDEWKRLPPPPTDAWPALADVAWTGDELIVVGGLPGASGPPEHLVGARLDWQSMTWRALPDVWPQPVPFEGNLGSQSIAWTGDRLVVVAAALGSGFDPLDSAVASYDPTSDQWFLLDDGPGVQGWNRPLLAFDDRLVPQWRQSCSSLMSIGSAMSPDQYQPKDFRPSLAYYSTTSCHVRAPR